VVSKPSSTGTSRARSGSRTATPAISSGAPALALRSADCSVSSRYTCEPTTPQPSSATFSGGRSSVTRMPGSWSGVGVSGAPLLPCTTTVPKTSQLPSPTPAPVPGTAESRQRCADLADCQGVIRPKLSQRGQARGQAQSGQAPNQRQEQPLRFGVRVAG